MKNFKVLLPVYMLLVVSVVFGQGKKTISVIKISTNLTDPDTTRPVVSNPATINNGQHTIKAKQTEKRNIVFGRVTNKKNEPLKNLLVRVYDKDLVSQVILGETVTDNEGNYEITWQASKVTDGKKGINILIKVLTTELKTLLFTSTKDSIRYNASAKEEMNIIIETEVKRKAN